MSTSDVSGWNAERVKRELRILIYVFFIFVPVAIGGVLWLAHASATASGGAAASASPAERAFFQQLDEAGYGTLGAAEQGETVAIAHYVCALRASGVDDAHALLTIKRGGRLHRGDDAAVVVAAVAHLCTPAELAVPPSPALNT